MLSKEFLVEYHLQDYPTIVYPTMIFFIHPHVQERLDYREPDDTTPSSLLGYQVKTMADVKKITDKIGNKGVKYQNKVKFGQYWISDMSVNMSLGLNRVLGTGSKYHDKPGLMLNLMGTVMTPAKDGSYVEPRCSEGQKIYPIR